MMEATPFATSISGSIILPVIAGLVVVALVGGVTWLRHVTATLSEQNTTLALIKGEVQTNGGGSLKDAVLLMRAEQHATGARLDEHLADAGYQRHRLDDAIAGLAGIRPTNHD